MVQLNTISKEIQQEKLIDIANHQFGGLRLWNTEYVIGENDFIGIL